MRLGNSVIVILIIFFSYNFLKSEEKITTTPLINVDEITPSFEELEEENENLNFIYYVDGLGICS